MTAPWHSCAAELFPTLASWPTINDLRRRPIVYGAGQFRSTASALLNAALKHDPVLRPLMSNLRPHTVLVRQLPTSRVDAMKVCIVGASGKLGKYMIRHALDRGHQVIGVCRAGSVGKLDAFRDRITLVTGATNDREVIKTAVADCDGVLTVLVPWGVQQYATGTAQAVLDHARPGARLVFSCGWHITRDGRDVYSWRFRAVLKVFGWIARLARFADLDDQVEACRRIFASDTRWTVVRGSDLEEGESEGLPVWSRHVGDPVLQSNITRRVDFALFMVAALENDQLIHEAPAIVSCKSPWALAHAGAAQTNM